MAADTARRPQQALQLRAMAQPATVNTEARTVEVAWTTGARVRRTDGWTGASYIEELSLAPGAVRLERLNTGAPLLDSHASLELRNVVGVVERAWIENGEGRAVVRFSDRAEVEPIWRDVVAGILRNISVGYRIHKIERDESGEIPVERAVDWEPYELSLVPIPADAGAQVRSDNITQGDTVSTNNTIINTDNTDQQTRAERQRAAGILDCARRFEVSEELALRLIEEGVSLDEARGQIIDARSAEERRTPGIARVEVTEPGAAGTDLARQIERAMAGERLAEPLWLQLRRQGAAGANPSDVMRNALLGRMDRLVARGMHATTDLPALLGAAGDRLLQQQFQMASGGILAAASIRPLTDYRDASIIDVGKIGSAKKILEGGEINFSRIAESSSSYRPARHGDGFVISPEAWTNDDLGGLRQAIGELGAGALDAEKTELVYLLEGTANGGTCADGQPLFHTSHKNSVAAGPLGIDKLGEAVALLRGQKTIGGRYIDQRPGVILCGLAAELSIRQLLSDTLTANEPANVNPFRDLTVEVDPRIGDTYAYLISAGPRMPLELGRLYPAPQISDTVDFNTGAYKVKAEHAFGVAVAEFRSVVRLKLAA